MSLRLKAGSTVALVGQSGSGKLTIASLRPSTEPDSGAVLLDGPDIREYPLRHLRRQLSLVSQDVVLFDDSIAGIAYALQSRRVRRSGARTERTWPSSRPSRRKVSRRGLGERGVMLSGGQRQRIAIARAR